MEKEKARQCVRVCSQATRWKMVRKWPRCIVLYYGHLFMLHFFQECSNFYWSKVYWSNEFIHIYNKLLRKQHYYVSTLAFYLYYLIQMIIY